MNQFVYLKNFLFLELTSLGFAYALIQKFADETQIKVFEASPTPRGSILILVSPSTEALRAVLTNISGATEFQTQIENTWLGEGLSERLIEAYLNQILAPLKENLVLFESESICESVKATALALDNNFEICEFRILRSAVYKCIVSLTTSLTKTDVEKMFTTLVTTKKIKLSYVAVPTRELRNQYNLE